jgi:VIT1/CCC1 family predicted Fe2+/Mn2+ transporter
MCRCARRRIPRQPTSQGRRELAADVASESGLAGIYVQRGLKPALAKKVALQLMAHDAMGAMRATSSASRTFVARPVQAAIASALSFTAGAALPLLVAALTPVSMLIGIVATSSLAFLAALGALAARTGGANVVAGAWRVTFWGALAMLLTAAVGALFGTAVS